MESIVGTRVRYIDENYCITNQKGTIIEDYSIKTAIVKLDTGEICKLKKSNLIKINESEDNSMEKLEGYYAVAVTEQELEQVIGYNRRDYYYAIFDDGFKYDKYDNVLVSGANHTVLMIKDIITPEEAREKCEKDITEEVICKVDFDRYNKRVEERKEAAERKKEADKIKKQMDKMVEEMDKNKMYESYARFNPELAKKLKVYKELIGE